MTATGAKQIPLTLHPFLIGALSFLICYRDITPYVSVSEFVTVFGVFAAIVALFHLLANRIYSSRLKGGMASSITVALFCFAAEIRTLVEWTMDKVSALDYANGVYVLVALLVIWILSLALLFRSKCELAELNRFLSVVGIAVVAATVWQVAKVSEGRKVVEVPLATPAPLKLPANPPDIYHIVMDAYTSAESLKAYWDYDNSPFVDFLSGNGFQVVKDAKGNYDLTPQCMATYLGMNHPTNVPAYSFMAKLNYFADLLQTAVAPERLKASGYEIVNYSLFDVAGEKRFYRYPMIEPMTLQRRASSKSMFGLLADVERIGFRDVNLQIFSELPRVATQKQKKPRFVYAHLMMPHCPYLFDEHGNHVVSGLHNKDQKKEDYLAHLIYANKMLTNTIAGILKNSAQPPIIILQGDHGFRSLQGPGHEAERLTILNAYHLPGSQADWVYDGITPVNSFRMIFNRYFGENYPFVSDKVESVNPLGKMKH